MKKTNYLKVVDGVQRNVPLRKQIPAVTISFVKKSEWSD